MIQDTVERRSEFRFPVVIPVEYFPPNNSSILSYTLDLSRKGAFVSSDDHPVGIGARFGIHLNIPVDYESSRTLRTEGTVVWNRMQPFKSKRNGMGVKFMEALPEGLLLNALASNLRTLVRETQAKRLLEERIEKLESELERVKRFVALGRCAAKILRELSNPMLTLSAKLEMITTQMYKHKGMLEKHGETNKEEFKKIITDFENCCREINQILKDYGVTSELAKIVQDDGETLERKLEKYK